MRQASILRRKPRTRRDRMIVRLHALREVAERRWKRLRRHRRRRSAHVRAQDLFLQLGHGLHYHPHEPAVRARHARPHLRRR